jgi:hypothetical protein
MPLFGRALPGFTMLCDYDHSAWAFGYLVPAAQKAMANYLAEFKIQQHSSYKVTLDHIASESCTALAQQGP